MQYLKGVGKRVLENRRLKMKDLVYLLDLVIGRRRRPLGFRKLRPESMDLSVGINLESGEFWQIHQAVEEDETSDGAPQLQSRPG